MQINYPGFTIQDFFTPSVIPIPYCRGSREFKFDRETITFDYNNQGYRNKEFNQLHQKFILVTGCSHSEGHGLHLEQTWPTKLAKELGLDLANIAKGGSNSRFCSQNTLNWLEGNNLPSMILAQWPNPYRFLTWTQGKAQFILNSNDELFKSRVMLGDDEIWANWIRDIVVLDRLAKKHNKKILHICLEEHNFISRALPELDRWDIKLHIDEKVSGRTWFFDSGAADNLHHSEWCHTKWVERILTLL